MTRDEILAEAREKNDGSIDAVIEIARREGAAEERAAAVAWLDATRKITYARRSYAAANAYHQAARRIGLGMHRNGKATS